MGENEKDFMFIFQFGLNRDIQSINASSLNIENLRHLAADFVNNKLPDHGIHRIEDRLLLYRHDYTSNNVLHMVSTVSDLSEGSLIEIVLSDKMRPGTQNQLKSHTLSVHSYKTPTFCDFCGEMLFGLVRQGLKCEDCGQNFHKRCVVKVPNKCSHAEKQNSSTQVQNSTPTSNAATHCSNSSDEIEDSSLCHRHSWRNSHQNGRSSWRANGYMEIPHTFVVHTYTRPTVCQYCKKLLKGLYKQGYQCRDCKYNAHKKCKLQAPKDCATDYSSGDSIESQSKSDENSLCDEHKTRTTDEQQTNGSTTDLVDLVPSHDDEDGISYRNSIPNGANIPLQRIVQSVKHTKKKAGDGGGIIKEGWLVHFTNKNKTLRNHYWRLDAKCITLFQNERDSKFYKEIELSDILAIDHARLKQGDFMHCFEIRTVNVDYFVGQEINCEADGSNIECSHSTESGVGAHLAKSWETAIRQAIVPHTINSERKFSDTSDHTGNELADVNEIYQIHPDEILGSGQFGIVYGGMHKKSGEVVAIKVIDKLRFPTKQEAQLKNEVAILQNLSHPGVVNLERMFETPERIFVIMEKLKGDMLDMILSHELGRLNERITKFLITQILMALKHLHSKNIVHCDLKPENVLLSSDDEFPQVKLCDFGFARIIGEKSFRRSVVGTPAYLAPEVLRNKGYNRSLDMWSVGVIIYVSLSGTFPFNEEEDINDQIQNADFMYPCNTWKDISSDAIDLIANLLQVKQRKRFTVDKSLQHIWLQSYETWTDLRKLEMSVGTRYLTHESDDHRWEKYTAEL